MMVVGQLFKRWYDATTCTRREEKEKEKEKRKLVRRTNPRNIPVLKKEIKTDSIQKRDDEGRGGNEH